MVRYQNPLPAPGQRRLVGRARDVIRRLRRSVQTEQAYVDRIRRLMLFYGTRHPEERGAVAAEAFSDPSPGQEDHRIVHTEPRAERHRVLLPADIEKGIRLAEGIERAKKPATVPVLFTRDEGRAVLARSYGVRRVVASRLYGSGLRLMEDAGGASGTSIRIETPPAILVSTTSSPLAARSPGSIMPPWHRAS